MPLLLRTAHTLELEVAVVGLRSDSLALKDDEGDRSDDLKIVSDVTSSIWHHRHTYRDEVQRQVHEVPNNR